MNALLGCVMLVLCGNIAGNSRKDSLKKMCPALKLRNGKVKYLRAPGEQNPHVQFNCKNNFGLIGERGATCLSVTRLSTKVPFCASPGCREIPARDDVRVTRLEDGRVLHFQCEPGMRRKGPQTLLCNGDTWNDRPPDCVPMAMPNCNFEHPYLCGWSQDFNDDHDWQWASKATPIRKTGPLEDYKETIDHYIFIDNAFPNKPRHVTRLISPTLLPSSGLCMAFDYQIHGLDKQREVGFLDIHIISAKKEEIQIFHQECDKGNQWIKGETTIPVQSSDFQVVITATCGNSSEGYMALDNIKFSSCTEQAAGKPQFSERCAADRSNLTTVLVPPSSGVTGTLETSKRLLTTTTSTKPLRETTPTQSLVEIPSTQNPTELSLGISFKTVDSPRPVTPPDGLLHSSKLPLTPLITDGPAEASSFGTNTANTISATAENVVNPSWNADTRENTSMIDDERQSTSLDTNNTSSKGHAPISTSVATRDSVTFSLTEGLGTRMITEVADTLGTTELRLMGVSVTSTPSALFSPRYVSSSDRAEPEAVDRRQIETEPAVNTVTHDPPAVNTVTHDPPAVNTVTHDPPAVNTVTLDPPAVNTVTHDPPAVNTVTHDPPAVNTVTLDPPAVNTVTHDPPAVNTVTHDPPAVNTVTLDPPVVNTVAHDPPAVNTVTLDPPAVNTVTHEPSDLQTPDPASLPPGQRGKESVERNELFTQSVTSPKSLLMTVNTEENNQPTSFPKLRESFSGGMEVISLSSSIAGFPSKKTVDVISNTDIVNARDTKNEHFDKGNDHIENNTRYRKQKSGDGLRISDYLPLLGTVFFGLFLGMFLIGFAAWKWAQNQERKFEKVNSETTEDNDVTANA